MWTAKILNKTLSEGVLSIGVEYTNGTETFLDSFTSSGADDLASFVQRKIDALDKIYSSAGKVGDIITKKQSVAITPTKEQLDRSTYGSDLALYKKCLEAVKLGILTGNETQVQDVKSRLVSNYQASYIDLF